MKIFSKKEKPATVSANQNLGARSIFIQLLSPATGLAILGTVALIFSFYRGGQLATLVIPQDQINGKKENPFSFKDRPKIDINSQGIISAADSSEAALIAISGDYKQAANQAIKDLTDNPPDYLPTIVEAGDILSQFGDDRELGFGLLERAVIMAPNNQYVILRYCQRLVSVDLLTEAEPKLLQLVGKYPQWADPRIVLSKIHFLQNNIPKASTELIALSNSKDLNSKQLEQVSLLLAKLGRMANGFAIFQNAASFEPKDSFYTSYCQDWLTKNPGSYDTVLAMVKTNLAENKNSTNVLRRLGLEIKHAALLLLLGRAQDAQTSLEPIISANPKNFDLHILQAAAYVILEKNDKAKIEFQKAVTLYQPKS
jgi:tetratricopeptide (TPR) repeat protein